MSTAAPGSDGVQEPASLETLQAACVKVAQSFTAVAGALKPTSTPMETCYALRAAAEEMAVFAEEYGRYFEFVEDRVAQMRRL